MNFGRQKYNQRIACHFFFACHAGNCFSFIAPPSLALLLDNLQSLLVLFQEKEREREREREGRCGRRNDGAVEGTEAVACTDGHLEIVKEIAGDPSVDFNWVEEDRLDTPLHRACRFGWLEIGKVLLAQEKIEVNKGNKGNASPFFIACQEGHKEVVSFLLADPRIDPNKPTDAGVTPFFMACQEGHKEVVSLLLADPRMDPNKSKNGRTTPFFKACEKVHKEVVSLLLADPRIDPNLPKDDGTTPLWFASQEGHVVVVPHMLASGREIDTRKRSNFNSLTAAEQGAEGPRQLMKPTRFSIEERNTALPAQT